MLRVGYWIVVLAASLMLLKEAGAGLVITPTSGNATGQLFTWCIDDVVNLGGPEGLVGFTLQVVASDPTDPNPDTFDGVAFGNTGITGVLHHEQFTSPFPPFQLITPDVMTSGGSTNDTHFLVDPSAISAVTAPTEDLVDDGSSDDPGAFGGITGFGTNLTGTFSLTGGNPSPVWDLAYIVSTPGTQINVSAAIAGAGQEESFNFAFTTVPEPGAAVFCGTALLLFVLARRPVRLLRRA